MLLIIGEWIIKVAGVLVLIAYLIGKGCETEVKFWDKREYQKNI